MSRFTHNCGEVLASCDGYTLQSINNLRGKRMSSDPFAEDRRRRLEEAQLSKLRREEREAEQRKYAGSLTGLTTKGNEQMLLMAVIALAALAAALIAVLFVVSPGALVAAYLLPLMTTGINIGLWWGVAILISLGVLGGIYHRVRQPKKTALIYFIVCAASTGLGIIAPAGDGKNAYEVAGTNLWPTSSQKNGSVTQAEIAVVAQDAASQAAAPMVAASILITPEAPSASASTAVVADVESEDSPGTSSADERESAKAGGHQAEALVVIKAAEEAPAPSFDCKKARLTSERLVCSEKELAALDVEMHKAYLAKLNSAEDREAIKGQQIDWIKGFFRACSTSECLSAAYKMRLAELK